MANEALMRWEWEGGTAAPLNAKEEAAAGLEAAGTANRRSLHQSTPPETRPIVFSSRRLTANRSQDDEGNR